MKFIVTVSKSVFMTSIHAVLATVAWLIQFVQETVWQTDIACVEMICDEYNLSTPRYGIQIGQANHRVRWTQCDHVIAWLFHSASKKSYSFQKVVIAICGTHCEPDIVQFAHNFADQHASFHKMAS